MSEFLEGLVRWCYFFSIDEAYTVFGFLGGWITASIIMDTTRTTIFVVGGG